MHFGYSPFVQNIPFGNNGNYSQPMTPTRGISPFAQRSFPNFGIPQINRAQLQSQSLSSSFHGNSTPRRDFTPQRPLSLSNYYSQGPINQIPQFSFPPHLNFITPKDQFVNKVDQSSNIHELYQKAMNRTNETLLRVRQKEARINMVLKRNHNLPNQAHSRPFNNTSKREEKISVNGEPKLVQPKPEATNEKSSNSYVKIELKDGFYEGEMCNTSREGFGILKDLHGNTIYKGYWVKDQFEGKGKAINMNVENHSVDFINDFDKLKNNWCWYEGEFKGGKFHGYGSLQISNGDKFAGYFEENKANGSGNYTYANGELVVGVWAHNKLENTF